MLTSYHCWIYENHKIESVEVLRESNRVSNKSNRNDSQIDKKHDTRSNTREICIPNTFFGKSNQDTGSEPPTKHRICSEFKAMEVSKRWEYAKKLKWCFRCLGESHQGQSCFRTRICGLDGCQEIHHRLLYTQTSSKQQ